MNVKIYLFIGIFLNWASIVNHTAMIIPLPFSLIFYGSVINVYLFHGTMFCDKKVHSAWRTHFVKSNWVVYIFSFKYN